MKYSYDQARERVLNTPELKSYFPIIFYDWPDWEAHLEWVCTASLKDITSWADAIAHDNPA